MPQLHCFLRVLGVVAVDLAVAGNPRLDASGTTGVAAEAHEGLLRFMDLSSMVGS